MDQLLSLPLNSILAQASGISADSQSVESELTNLCFREYPTFISVHKCSAAVTSAFDDFSESLGRLLDAVPALEDECRTFVKGTTGVQNARAKAALVQEHQDKLFDLLEIPQLMDTCVRNGYYQEALELSAHTESLLKRYPEVEIIQDVSKEVDGVMQVMLAQLLSLLRESIKLPALVKTVGYLRRLKAMGESELCLAFLISRLSNFRNQLVHLERDRADPVRYVRKYIDLFREHVFDIISQFTIIFLESSQSLEPASQLASFVGQCVNELVSLVGEYVPKMSSDAAALSSILVQLGYCALAFARVGLDFAPLITDPFSDAVLMSFTSTVDAASTTLAKALGQAERAHGSPSQALVTQDYVPSLMANDSPVDLISWNGDLEALPSDLARFPPLALLVNSHLSALNSLRLLAPLHLYPALAAAQAAALLSSTHRIAQYVRQAVASSDPGSIITSSDRPGLNRTSSGRAVLLRRNSETQLTPEARASKRKETQWACIAFADTWVKTAIPLLHAALDKGVFDGAEGEVDRAKLDESVHSLQTWIESQKDTPISPASVAAPEQSKRSSMFINGGNALLPHAEDAEDLAAEPAAEELDEDSANRDMESALDREVEAVLAAGTLDGGEAVESTAEEPLEAAPPQPILEEPLLQDEQPPAKSQELAAGEPASDVLNATEDDGPGPVPLEAPHTIPSASNTPSTTEPIPNSEDAAAVSEVPIQAPGPEPAATLTTEGTPNGDTTSVSDPKRVGDESPGPRVTEAEEPPAEASAEAITKPTSPAASVPAVPDPVTPAHVDMADASDSNDRGLVSSTLPEPAASTSPDVAGDSAPVVAAPPVSELASEPDAEDEDTPNASTSEPSRAASPGEVQVVGRLLPRRRTRRRKRAKSSMVALAS